MEQYAFIHGSSVGQSIYIPSGAPNSICTDIANKYFQGRVLRQKEAALKYALFVDIYKSSDGIDYCVYSFVNNDCVGANDRQGQYFALSVICKESFVYPEDIYRMLLSAYNQMYNTGKILGKNKKQEDKYFISQFDEEKEYLSVFLQKIEEAFVNITKGYSKPLPSNVHGADYNTWRGVKVNAQLCNTTDTFNNLCNIGRLYIAEEYESSSDKIKSLEGRIQTLESQNAELEDKVMRAKNASASKSRDEIERLNSKIREQENEIKRLQTENEDYQATIDTVNGKLEKYAKISKKISGLQDKKTQYKPKTKSDLLKTILLFIILIISIFSFLLSYLFFRDISQLLTKEQEVGESVINQPSGKNDAASLNTNSVTTGESEKATSLVVTPNDIRFESTGGKKRIQITTDGNWKMPESTNDWLAFEKTGNNQLTINVVANESTNDRISTFMINAGSHETQIKVAQKGKATAPEKIEHNVVVMTERREILAEKAFVNPGQKLVAKVTSPQLGTNGYGWACHNCTKSDSIDAQTMEFFVGENAHGTVVISYGKLGLQNLSLRKRFELRVNDISN